MRPNIIAMLIRKQKRQKTIKLKLQKYLAPSKRILILLAILTQIKCSQKEQYTTPIFEIKSSNYSQVGIKETFDTIHFPLDSDTYNAIKSFNLFENNFREYIGFYDQRSQSLNVFDLQSGQLFKKMSLRQLLKGQRLYKTSMFIKNFDSVFINNNKSLYLVDTSGLIKNKIDFLDNPRYAWATFENKTPLLIKDKIAFAAVRPYVKESSLEAQRNWKVIYAFDIDKNKASLHYHMPELLRENYYGHRFQDFSYCVNKSGNFVLSFPADTLIYETNLGRHHKGYFAKSQFQEQKISPLKKDDILNDKGLQEYIMRDSYGAIYFDPTTTRYLRASYRKLNEKDYLAKTFRRQQLIILNAQFEIVGESEVDKGIMLNTLIFSKYGEIYARVLPEDEYAIHFIKLSYIHTPVEVTHLIQK